MRFVRSLLFQIFSQRHNLLHYAISALFSIFVFENMMSIHPWWQLLEAVLSDPSTGQVGIIVYAIDECEKVTRLQFIKALLKYLQRHRTNGDSIAKLLISSRPSVAITDTIDSQYNVIRLWEKDNAAHIQ